MSITNLSVKLSANLLVGCMLSVKESVRSEGSVSTYAVASVGSAVSVRLMRLGSGQNAHASVLLCLYLGRLDSGSFLLRWASNRGQGFPSEPAGEKVFERDIDNGERSFVSSRFVIPCCWGFKNGELINGLSRVSVEFSILTSG